MNLCAVSSGRNTSAFFAYWCTRISFTHCFRVAFGESTTSTPSAASLPLKLRRRPYADPPRRRGPDGQIGLVIADIVESAFAESLDEARGLVLGGHIGAGVRGEPAVEQADMGGDRGDEFLIAGGGDEDAAARGARLLTRPSTASS